MLPVKAISRGFLAVLLAGAVGLISPPASADDPAFVGISAGWFDFNDDVQSTDFRIEYRSSYKLFGALKPWGGLEANTDGAVYPAGGLLADLFFGRRIVLTPSFGVGIYAPHNSKELGHEIEFRSQLELGYRFDDRSRLSVAISHISNASLDDNNPGTEILSVYYHIPVTKLLRAN